MTLPLFPSPPATRLRARKISCDGMCGPTCPELEWINDAPFAPSCKLFESALVSNDGRAVRCKACIQESNR